MQRLMNFINSGRHRKEEWPEDLSEDVIEWVESKRANRKAEASDPELMLPPWIKYPHIPAGSVGWRMGPGEDYWMDFLWWMRKLSESDFEAYKLANPAPSGWDNFYTMMR